jgi:hypothetical protein
MPAIHGNLISGSGPGIEHHATRQDSRSIVLIVVAADECQSIHRSAGIDPSKSLPAVVIVTLPLAGAVQVHHAECPPVIPAMSGSPASRVAPALAPVVLVVEPVSLMRLANMLFAGGTTGTTTVSATLSEMCPVAPW